MSKLDDYKVVSFGKILFTPRNHTVPTLPDMNLLILKDNNDYRAICIDLELDSMGSSMENACDNIKNRLLAYTTQMVDIYSDVKSAAE